MKNLSVFISFFLLTFYSCRKNDAASELNSDVNKKLANTTYSYGQIHNDFMSFINEDFKINNKKTSKKGAFKQVTSFYAEKLKTYSEIPKSEKTSLLDGINNNQELLETNALHDIIRNKKTIENPLSRSQTTLSVLIGDLHQNKIISDKELEKLKKCQEMLSDVFDNKVVDVEFTKFLQVASNSVEKEDFLFRTITDIGISSYEWWNNNTPDIYLPAPVGLVTLPEDEYKTNALPAVVGTDIAGALIGGVMSAGIQYAVNKNVNWTIVAATTVGGAIIASTGVVGKLGKWISKIF